MSAGRNAAGAAAALLALIGAAGFISLLQGDAALTAAEALAALFRPDAADPSAAMIVLELRLPRTLLAVLAGMGLGIGGLLAQTFARNPLADPGLLGINGGAAFAVTLCVVALRNVPAWAIPWAGFAGAAAATALVTAAAWKDGIAPLRLVLVGIGLSAVLGALTTLMTVFGDLRDVQRALVWLTGSLYGSDWDRLAACAPWLLAPAAVAWALTRQLDLLLFPDEVAAGLGQGVHRQRGLAILTCVVISGAAVAACGPVGFVGLMAPHAARRLAGTAHAATVPLAALVGALLVLCADLAGRTVVAPAQLPVGLVTALLGAPFFLYLLWTQRNA